MKIKMRIKIIFPLCCFLVLLGCRNDKNKRSLLINESEFIISNPSNILVVDDTLIAFTTSDFYLVMYNVSQNKAEKILDVRKIVNADSIYSLNPYAIKDIPYDSLVYKYNNGNKVWFDNFRLNFYNNAVWANFEIFTPQLSKLRNESVIGLYKYTYYLKYNLTSKNVELFEIEDSIFDSFKNNKITKTPLVIQNFAMSIIDNSEIIVSTLSPDSIHYTSQYICYTIDKGNKKLKLKDTVRLPNITPVYYYNAKLPFVCIQKINNNLYASDFKKIFNITTKKEVETELFKTYNNKEYLYSFWYVNQDTTIIDYITYKTDSIKKHVFLNQYNYNLNQHQKREIQYADKILSYVIYNNKLYYFEKKDESYYINIVPVTF
jgi:hypothetical protein